MRARRAIDCDKILAAPSIAVASAVSGAVMAALSGIGFGVFQTLNGQIVRRMADSYLAMYFQIVVSAVVLAGIALAAGELRDIAHWDAEAMFYFGASGVIHFTFGWYFLTLAQKRIGAARTGVLLAATPLIGTLLAIPLAGQLPGLVVIPAMVLMVIGAASVSGRGAGFELQGSGWALATATAWSISSILVLDGYARLPLIAGGVAFGMLAAVVTHTVLLVATGKGRALRSGWHQALGLRLAAGVAVALATWGRWAALDTTDVAIVLALNLISVPVVLLLAPLTGHRIERVDRQLWLGSVMIIIGAIILILVPSG